jgi:catechol 2,3-dioxygenase-like lactoylglutathione lyase family enzyme
MNRYWTRPLLLVPLLAVLLSTPGLAGDDPRQAHGVFTGEIKAVLYVRDVEKSAPFYRDVLGFGFLGHAELDGQPYYAEMTAANVKFGLHEPMSAAQEARVGQQRLYFRVADLQAHRARLLAWGAQPDDIRETAWMDMFIVRDPDGNEIVFAVTDPGRHASDPWSAGKPPEGSVPE